MPSKLSATFQRFFASEKLGGMVLLVCTVVSLLIANSALSAPYLALWQTKIAGLSIEHWINDGLMAVFFLLVGLELERELYNGELSQPRKALLPILAAAGGIAVPALIHFAWNAGQPTQPGIGIPMATDIAFALGVMALLGDRIPPALKIFLTALAVMDDLGAIIVIALFYSSGLDWAYLLGAAAVFGVLVLCNRVGRVMALWPYLLGGAVMWFCMLKSGVHATIAGVLLAFAIPFSARAEDQASPSHRLEHTLHLPVALGILPLFALANTGIVIGSDWFTSLLSPNGLGIMMGLILGKPIGILLLCWIAVRAGWCQLPEGVQWKHIAGAGMLAGIGFTMSIFITNLAFAGQPALIDASKMAVLLASVVAGVLGLASLRFATARRGK